jgi:hypothetical protein
LKVTRFAVPSQLIAKLAGVIRRFLPNRRDREVPHGMKGGEEYGLEEKRR